jgi:hemolysin III
VSGTDDTAVEGGAGLDKGLAVGGPVKPAFRGRSHRWAFVASAVVGLALVFAAPDWGARAIVLIYALTLSGMFGISALFHLVTWSPPARRRMRRLDHAMIFLAIAGTYTAVIGLAVPGAAATTVLWVVWIGAVVGVALNLAWIDAPKPVTASVYVVVGWAALAIVPQLVHSLGVTGFVLLVLGGALYTAGAIVYALRRPDPSPEVFGYHEVFHALVIAAAASHFVVVAFIALPRA